MELSPGAKHYLVTALWSTVDTDEVHGPDYSDTYPLDEKYCVDDISTEFKEQSQKDYDKFYALAQNLFEEDELDFETIGHDFWLTRNGHGAGFWDGDYRRGKELTKIVKDNFKPNDDELRKSLYK